MVDHVGDDPRLVVVKPGAGARGEDGDKVGVGGEWEGSGGGGDSGALHDEAVPAQDGAGTNEVGVGTHPGEGGFGGILGERHWPLHIEADGPEREAPKNWAP